MISLFKASRMTKDTSAQYKGRFTGTVLVMIYKNR